MEPNRVATSKKILVVDDDEDIREIIIYVRESEGYSAYGLNNGKSVIETVHQIKADIVLFDVELCGGDGKYICNELKK